MDIRCPKCGEPWEHDCLHEVVTDGMYPNYDAAAKAFRKDGCVALGSTHNEPSTEEDAVWGLRPQDAAAALYDILGDDMDGAAAMLEDMGF